MFTGIIAETGTIRGVNHDAQQATLDIATTFAALELGESIAVDGTCLTVTKVVAGGFHCDAAAETLAKTTLGKSARRGQPVHLERALRAADRLGGHIVTGHVDGLATVVSKEPIGEAMKLVYEAPAALSRHIAPKGSVCIDGVSLTVNGVSGQRFDVVLVPYTRTATHLDRRAVGDEVNLETDVLAKYIERLMTERRG